MENNLIEPSRGSRTIRLLASVGQGPMLRYHKKIAELVIPWRKRHTPLTLKECCKRLEAKGIKTFRGRMWSPSRLVTILAQMDTKK